MRNQVIILVALVILASALAGLYFYTISQAELQPPTFQVINYTTFRIDENGDAWVEMVEEYPPSDLTEFIRTTINGGTFRGLLIRGRGVENTKLLYVGSMRGKYARYGLELENVGVDSVDIIGLSSGETLRVTMTWKIPYFADRYENTWRILIEPVDNESFALEYIDEVKSLQSVLPVISENSRISMTVTTSIILPSGAGIVNEDELLGIGTITVSYGGGTYENSIIHIREIGGKQAVVTESDALITSQLITITPEEFLRAYPIYPIDYTGAPPAYGFGGSAARITLDMKFGRALKEKYSVSFDGLELGITPSQLTYYSAKKIVILAENAGTSLLADNQLISVTPPENEGGDWRASWENLAEDNYVALARTVRDQIELSGVAPGTVSSAVGGLRFRDVLFTFLRAISFYHGRGELPDTITFAPMPTGSLTRENDNIPADHAYFLLSTQYVITDTLRANQIVSNIRDPDDTDMGLAEKLNNWVYENITYQLTLGQITSEEVLDVRVGKCLEKATLYLALIRTAGLPAREVSGFITSTGAPVPPFDRITGVTPDGKYIVGHAWAEVYIPGEGWISADPTWNNFRTLVYVSENRVYSSAKQTWQDVLVSHETTYGKLI